MARTTIGTCDHCLPLEDRKAIAARTGRSLRSVGATLEADHEDGAPVWRCRNCGRPRPRRVRERGPVQRTPHQQRMLDRFVAAALEDASLGKPEDYEVKRLDVTDPHVDQDGYASRTLYASLVVGRKGDEGTLGEVFCRNRWHVAIGPKGGISPVGTRHKSKRPRGLWATIRQGDEDRNRRIASLQHREGRDLPAAQRAVFQALPEDGDSGRLIADLAQRLKKHPSSIRQALHRLEAAGRVRSWPSPLGRAKLYGRVPA